MFGYANLRPRFFWLRRLRILNEFASGGRLLDVGCAFGIFIKHLEKIFEVYGVDISEYAVKQAQALLKCPERIKAHDINLALPFNGQFDVVTAFDVLEHLSDPAVAIKNLHNALKSGGYLFIELPTQSTLIDCEMLHYYKPLATWVELLAQAGFNVLSVRTYYTVGFRVIMIPSGRIANYCSIIARKAKTQ